MTVPPEANPIPAQAEGDQPPAVPLKMTVITARRYGDSKVLAIESVPTPEPEAGRLLVKVMAASANAYDWHMLSGEPRLVRLFAGLLRPKRLIPGSDVAGIVVAIGADAVGFNIGDALFGPSRGSFAEYTTVNAALTAVLPKGVDFDAAGATPMAGITALQALRSQGEVKPGDRVLINGAAGGVGTFAIQLAKVLGAAEVTAVCSTKNAEQAHTLGADRVVDYLHEDFASLGERYDVVIDNVGNRTPAEIRSILAPDGRYVGVSGPMTNRWFGPVLYQSKMKRALKRTDANYRGFTANNNAEDFEFLAGLLASGQISPVIDRVVGLDGVASALDQIATGHGRGKVVIVPSRGLEE